MTTLITAQSESTVNEWDSIKALYAVESGVQASAYLINQSAVPGGSADCDAADTASAIQIDSAVDAWYTIESTADTITGVNVCRIVATGMAGGSSGSPVSQREFNIIYSAIVNQ